MLGKVVASVFLFGLLTAWNQALRDMDVAWVVPPREGEKRVNPDFAKTIATGFAPLWADSLWMQAMLDPSIAHIREGKHASIFYDLILATELDPVFYEAYLHGGNHLAVIRDDDMGALELLTRGERIRKEVVSSYPEEFREKYWKNSWSIPLALAYVQLYELEDLPSAAISFEAASKIPGAPSYSQLLAKRLANPAGRFEVGIGLANFLAESAKDPRIKAAFEEKRDSLIVSKFYWFVNESLKAYREKHPRLGFRESWLAICTPYCEKDPFGNEILLAETGRVRSKSERIDAFKLDSSLETQRRGR